MCEKTVDMKLGFVTGQITSEENLLEQHKGSLLDLLRDSCVEGNHREEIIAKQMNWDWNSNKQGVDAFIPGRKKYPVEIKSEAFQGRVVRNPLSGIASFGKKKKETLEDFFEKNVLMCHAGFDDDGKMRYILTYLIQDAPKVIKILRNKAVSGNGANTPAKFGHSQYKDALSLKIHYFIDGNKIYTKSFRKLLTSTMNQVDIPVQS